MRFLLFIWKHLPLWLQGILSRIIRPSFQVFAAAVIFDQEQRILLEKLTYQEIHAWGLPGGNVNYGEEPEDTVVREVKEELGFDIKIKKLLTVKNAEARHILGLFYWCEITGGNFSPTVEVSEIKYFPLDDLPDVRPSDQVLLKQLSESVHPSSFGGLAPERAKIQEEQKSRKSKNSRKSKIPRKGKG